MSRWCVCRGVEGLRRSRRTVVISRLDRRVFRKRVDFITSPGLRPEDGSRLKLGIPGAGPTKVITDKAVLEADPVTGELILGGLYPGVDPAEVAAGVCWPLRSGTQLDYIPPPGNEELHLLREVLDPKRLYLKG